MCKNGKPGRFSAGHISPIPQYSYQALACLIGLIIFGDRPTGPPALHRRRKTMLDGTISLHGTIHVTVPSPAIPWGGGRVLQISDHALESPLSCWSKQFTVNVCNGCAIVSIFTRISPLSCRIALRGILAWLPMGPVTPKEYLHMFSSGHALYLQDVE